MINFITGRACGQPVGDDLYDWQEIFEPFSFGFYSRMPGSLKLLYCPALVANALTDPANIERGTRSLKLAWLSDLKFLARCWAKKSKEDIMRRDENSFNDKVIPNLARGLGKSWTLFWRLFTSTDVPLGLKFIPALSFIYWVLPFDMFIIPLIGATPIDDVSVILLGLKLFVELCPRDLVERFRNEIEYGIQVEDNDDGGQVIDASYQILDDE